MEPASSATPAAPPVGARESANPLTAKRFRKTLWAIRDAIETDGIYVNTL
jgi:hypothetical protein